MNHPLKSLITPIIRIAKIHEVGASEANKLLENPDRYHYLSQTTHTVFLIAEKAEYLRPHERAELEELRAWEDAQARAASQPTPAGNASPGSVPPAPRDQSSTTPQQPTQGPSRD